MNKLKADNLLAFLILCLASLSFPIYALFAKADANWDLFNYHLYVADTFWRNRSSNDLLAAGIMSYLPPLIDLPFYYGLVILHSIRLASIFNAVIEASTCSLLLIITRLTYPQLTPSKGAIYFILWLTLLGFYSPINILEIRSSFGDTITTPFLLISLAIILYDYSSKKENKLWLYIISGFFAGIAVGLKFTNLFYASLLPISVWINLYITNQKNKSLNKCLLYSVGLSLGGFITAGWWYIKVSRQFGSPFFPLYTKFFPSSLVAMSGGQVSAFGPKNLFQASIWPLLIGHGRTRHVMLGDWFHIHSYLWSFFYLAILLAASLLLVSQLYKKNVLQVSFNNLNLQERIIITWVSLSFVSWEIFFNILRYLAPIECLLPLALYALLNTFSYKKIRNRIITLIIISIIQIYSVFCIHYNWTTKQTSPFIQIGTPHLREPNNTSVLLFRPPIANDGNTLSWLIPFFPKEIHFTQIAEPDTNKLGVWANVPYTPKYDSIQRDFLFKRSQYSYVLIGSQEFPGKRHYSLKKEIAQARKYLTKKGYSFNQNSCKIYPMRYGDLKGEYAFCSLFDLKL